MTTLRYSAWHRLLVNAALLLAFVVLSWTAWFFYERAFLQETWKRALAAGIPQVYQSLLPEPVADEENAAVELGELAFKGFIKPASPRVDIPAMSPREKQALLASFAVSPLREEMALIEQATAKPMYQTKEHSPDRSAYDGEVLHFLLPLDNVQMRLLLRAETGDTQGAWQDAIRYVKLLEFMAESRSVHAQQKRFEYGSRLPMLLSTIVNNAPTSTPEALQQMLASLEQPYSSLEDPKLKRALQYRFSLDDEYLYHEEEARGSYNVSIRNWRNTVGRGASPALFSSKLHYYTYRYLGLPHYFRDEAWFLRSRVEELELLTDGLYAPQSLEDMLPPNPRIAHHYAAYRLYHPADLEAWAAMHQASLQVSRTALRILLKYGASGPFPDTPDLAAAITLPPSPYSMTPIRYLPIEQGFMVWCTPPDSEDDGRIAWYHHLPKK